MLSSFTGSNNPWKAEQLYALRRPQVAAAENHFEVQAEYPNEQFYEHFNPIMWIHQTCSLHNHVRSSCRAIMQLFAYGSFLAYRSSSKIKNQND